MGYGANLNLPFPDFANRLMATNKTGWFPHCASTVTLTHSAAAATTKTISQVNGRP